MHDRLYKLLPSPIAKYLRTCNLSQVNAAPLDLAVLAMVIVLLAVSYFVPGFAFAGCCLSFVILGLWLAASFVPLPALLNFEPTLKITYEFARAFLDRFKKLSPERQSAFLHELFDVGRQSRRTIPLLTALDSARHSLSPAIATAILNAIAAKPDSITPVYNSPEYSKALDLSLDLLNDLFDKNRIEPALERIVASTPDLIFAASILELAQPDLFGRYKNIYRCDLKAARDSMLDRCRILFTESQTDVFTLIADTDCANYFLHSWADGFSIDAGNSRPVIAYTSMLLERRHSHVDYVLAHALINRASSPLLDTARLRKICDPNKIRKLLEHIDTAQFSPDGKIAAALFLAQADRQQGRHRAVATDPTAQLALI